MVTIWVKSGSTPRPRRTHRLRAGNQLTECGLHSYFMKPVTTAKANRGIIPPQCCHICFKYRYRFLSRPKRDWRHQMQLATGRFLRNT
jgi:hypothetical protein